MSPLLLVLRADGKNASVRGAARLLRIAIEIRTGCLKVPLHDPVTFVVP